MSNRTVILSLVPLPLVAVALWQLDVQQLLGLLSVLLATAGACVWSLWHGRDGRPPRIRVPGTWSSRPAASSWSSSLGHAGRARWASSSFDQADEYGPRATDAAATLPGDDFAERIPRRYLDRGFADLETFLATLPSVRGTDEEWRPPTL